MERFFGLVTRRAGLTIAVILTITAFLAFHLQKLRIDTSLVRMMAEDLPAKQDYDRFKEEFGRASDDILVVVKAQDVFSPAVYEEMGKLTEALASIEGVKQVVSLPTLKRDMDILNEWTLKDLRRNLNLADIFVNNMVSADGKAAALAILLEETYQAGPLSEQVEKCLQRFRETERPLQIYQIGNPVIGYTLTKYTEKDLKSLPFFTMSVIFVILLFCFQSLRGAVVPLSAVCLALIWTFGLMGLLDVPVSVVTMIIPTFLIAVGSAYAMHLMAAYFDEAKKHDDHNRAIIIALTRVGLPSIFASITTIVGLASLLLNKIVVVREFAIFSCIGLFFMLFIHLTFIPATLSCLKMPGIKKPLRFAEGLWIDVFLRKILWAIEHHPRIIVAIASAITIISGVGLFRIKVETAPIEFFKESAPIRMAFEDAHRNLAGIYPINVILRSKNKGHFSSPKVLQQVGNFQKALTNIEGIDLAISVVDLLKLENLLTRGFKDKDRYYVLPDDPFVVKEAIKNYRMFQADEMVDHFISTDFSRVNVVCRTHLVSTADFIRAEATIRSYLRDHFSEDIDSDVTGICILGSRSSEALTIGQIKSLGLAMAFIFVMLSVFLVSAKVGLCAMLPNLFPIVVDFGVMGWAGIHLTVATSLIASIAIGLAVDDTIHYMFRFNHQFHKDFSRHHANNRTIADVGKPIVFTSLAMGLGFSVFLFSSFVPTTIFGILMVVTMASALYGDLLLLPLIMQTTPWLFIVMEKGLGFYRDVPLFKNLSLSEARTIVLTGARAHFPAGTTVYKRGDQGDGLYLILDGKVRLSWSGEGDLDDVTTYLGCGKVFGDIGIAGPVTRDWSATAIDDTVLLRIDKRTLDSLEKSFPRIAFGLYLNLAKAIDKREEREGYLLKRRMDRDL